MADVLALVPARGGSKGVPRKNLRPIGGTPIVVRAIECARAARCVDRIAVTTDDQEIADIASAAGAEVPFLRPSDLAADDTPDLPVYLHALETLADGADIVVWLRPTAPLRIPADVDAAVALLRETNADAVRSVCQAEHPPQWLQCLEGDRLTPFVDDGGAGRRQDLPAVYRLNGAVDVVRRHSVRPAGPLFAGDVRGYVMPRERSIDLDTELDFVLAEAVLAS